MPKFFVYTDGGARGNPGPAAIGIIIYNEDKKKIAEFSKFVGSRTNNQAEYLAVIEALKKIVEISDNNSEIHCLLDSELVVEQLNQRYKLKNEGLKPLFWEIRELVMKLGGKIQFEYISRNKNKLADKLVNEALDKDVSKSKF